jgi:hypothetical protein
MYFKKYINKTMEYKGISQDKIYPDLTIQTPTAPENSDNGHAFRLQKISEIQKELEKEKENRWGISKKYHRAIKAIQTVDELLIGLSIGLGAAGIGVLSTIIGTPIAIAMESSALGLGLFSIIGSQFNKKLMLKAEKHEKIKTLADSKLNSISGHISKALKDDSISDSEYEIVLSEIKNYNTIKEEIRSKIKVGIDEVTKQTLINQGKEEALNNFQAVFGRTSSFLSKPNNRKT